MYLKEALAMQETVSNLTSQKLPFALAYKFSKLATKLDEHARFYNENLQKLIEEYAEKDEDGQIKIDEKNQGGILIKTDLIEDFQNKVSELQNVEIEYDLPTFTFSDFEDKIELTTKEVYTLMPVIVEE